jgi:hypothetical protein
LFLNKIEENKVIHLFQRIVEMLTHKNVTPDDQTNLSSVDGSVQLRIANIHDKPFMAQCGHKTPLHLEMILGNKKIGTISFKETNIKWCPECFTNLCIRCGWCGNPILPGEAVTLNSPIDPNEQFPSYAYILSGERDSRIIGCLGWECPGCNSGGEIAGYLDSKDNNPFIRLIENPISKTFRTGETQVSNLDNPNNFDSIGAIPLSEFTHPT